MISNNSNPITQKGKKCCSLFLIHIDIKNVSCQISFWVREYCALHDNEKFDHVGDQVHVVFQTWADAFKGIPDFKEVGKVYQDLKKKGIEFPMTDLGTMAPIHTPARVWPLLALLAHPQLSSMDQWICP